MRMSSTNVRQLHGDDYHPARDPLSDLQTRAILLPDHPMQLALGARGGARGSTHGAGIGSPYTVSSRLS